MEFDSVVVHLVCRQDHVLAGEDCYVARENGCACRYINRRNRSPGRHADEMCLRSKQESPRREGSGQPQESYRRMSVNWGEGLDK